MILLLRDNINYHGYCTTNTLADLDILVGSGSPDIKYLHLMKLEILRKSKLLEKGNRTRIKRFK